MKKLFISIILITLSLYGQSVNVTIKVISPPLTSETLYITGNLPQLGSWNGKGIPFTRENDSLHILKLNFDKGISIEFKFTLGSWEREAIYEENKIPENHSLVIESDTTLEFTVINWSDKIKKRFSGQVTGKVNYYTDFNSEFVLSRDIFVWLPPNYDITNNIKYPVLYMHDGQNLIDPATSTFGVDWQIDEIADSLIRNKIINPFIFVGINNTVQRVMEYSSNEVGSAYMKFIVEELKPFIDSHYNTNPKREKTFNAGASMGGLISFIILWEYSDIFGGAGCFSPAFKIDRFDYIENTKTSMPDNSNIKLFVYNGGVGIERELQPGVDEMISLLLDKGLKLEKNITYIIDQNAVHSESAWSKQLPAMLKFFFGN